MSVHRERGAASTEIVLLVPALLFLILLTVQFGLWLHAQHVAQAAVDEGLRAARAASGTEVIGRDRAEAFLELNGSRVVEARSITVTRDADLARVTVTGNAPSVIPGFELPVQASGTAPIESFRADDG